MHFFTSLAAFAVLATGAYAQTQAQIQDCANSLKTVNCETYSTYSTSDTTLYSISYSYNTTLCTDPLIPVNRLYLTDQDANLQYSCTTVQFDSTGLLSSTCASKTLGDIASSGDPDWTITIRLGTRPSFYGVDNDFFVTAVSSPTASTAAARRRRALQARGEPLSLSSARTCPTGFNLCRTKILGQYECVDTSKDVEACGACPFDEASQDCTAIEGANAVQCRAGRCVVNSCDAYHTVSNDGTSCVANGKKRRSLFA